MGRKRIVIIGGGPGGYVAAIRAAQLGASVTLIEKDRMGGTCLNRGCIPTKALLADVSVLRSLKRFSPAPSLFQKEVDTLQVMMNRKNKVVREIVKGVEMLLESQRVTVKHARADLMGSNQVALFYGEEKRETVEADAIILAPGSRSKILPHVIPDGERIITSDQALEIREIPREIVIIGGGYIGVEFATIFRGLGSKVTIVEILDTILPGLETELIRNLRRAQEKDGIEVLVRSSVEEIRHEEKQLRLVLRTPKGIQEVTAEKLLLSVGRAPNLDLDFLKAEVETSSTGIQVNDRMETTASCIYAVGDAIGKTLLAHVAMEEGVVAAENAMGKDRCMADGPVPICIFTYPEIASVGLTEKEAREKGEIRIGRFPFRSNPKALISEETEGLIKVIARRETGEILGIHIFGQEASTLISTASLIIGQGLKGSEFYRFVQAHPTLPEALKEAILDIDGRAIHLPRPLREHRG